MKLKRPVIKGDVTQALCTVVDLVDASDFKAACVCLYDFLIGNTELLDFYPGALQRPENATDSKQQEQVFIWLIFNVIGSVYINVVAHYQQTIISRKLIPINIIFSCQPLVTAIGTISS